MSSYGFPRKLRLTDAAQFKAVFSKAGYKVSSKHLLILSKSNKTNHGRLGLVIGKKHIPRAVQRNRLKRLIRNSFRLKQDLLAGLDIVILARSNIAGLDNRFIVEDLDRLWSHLLKKAVN